MAFKISASRLHFWATIAWFFIGGAITWWATVKYKEPPWIAIMSWYAIVVSHWGSYEASLAKESVES